MRWHIAQEHSYTDRCKYRGFSFTGAEVETLEPEIKWRIISDFYQLKIAMGKHQKVKPFFENKTLLGTDISSDTVYWCEEVNWAQKSQGRPWKLTKKEKCHVKKNYEK